VNPAFELIGVPKPGGLLIIADHASNYVPDTIDLMIDSRFLNDHVAWDIGVDPVSRLIAKHSNCTAILGANSRLVVDLNRDHNEASVIPQRSDGIDIKGNTFSPEMHADRLKLYYHHYHDKIAACLRDARPALILSLHSFTPQLASKPDEARPWDIGILYNEDDRAARLAIPMLQALGLNVGDQLPYSGKLLNATMNRHAEANRIPYLDVEMRQDLVSNSAGQARFADILTEICHNIIEKLGVETQNE
jgi:predicted N-formylglutamate amidohydrolase